MSTPAITVIPDSPRILCPFMLPAYRGIRARTTRVRRPNVIVAAEHDYVISQKEAWAQ
ncbi:hypothetical protein [Bifidobacterium callimiconis]|uniref:hypothetical protein n=1 Tax=Bifidobacterium callimiconis TaxID=2306973 RepID=UPI001BDDAFF0|nr:hypothetical protein [Bifidobacterium callimiconis]